MPDTKHTHGPWYVTANPYRVGNRGPTGFDAPFRIVAETLSQKWHTVGLTDPDEAQANARLIAAAPELLEVAREALLCIERHVPPTEFAPRDWLRAVIAKATGG